MGQVKGILLGSAAGVALATGPSFAADLPSRKAEPVAYVKICDVYGRGFYYIPGTNTCLKVGGRVRFELGWHKAQNTWQQAGTARGGQFVAPVTTVGVGTTATNMLLSAFVREIADQFAKYDRYKTMTGLVYE